MQGTGGDHRIGHIEYCHVGFRRRRDLLEIDDRMLDHLMRFGQAHGKGHRPGDDQ
jgi:hypothetical protein